MSDWDFLYELKGQELKDALGSGASYSDWDYIERQQKERNRKKQSTKKKTPSSGSKTNKTNSGIKRKNTSLFIDGENISSKKANAIMRAAEKQGVIDGADRVHVHGFIHIGSFPALSASSIRFSSSGVGICSSFSFPITRPMQRTVCPSWKVMVRYSGLWECSPSFRYSLI